MLTGALVAWFSVALPFGQTLRSLNDPSWPRRLAWAAAVLLAGGWTAWLFLARMDVLETSRTARFESVEHAFDLEAEVDGRVVSIAVELGRRVDKGQLLVSLDSSAPELELEKIRTRVRGHEAKTETILREIEGVRGSLVLLEREGDQAARQTMSRLRQAEGQLNLATSESERARQLQAQGVASAAEADRAAANRHQQAEELAGMRAQLGRTQTESKLEGSRLGIRIIELERELDEARSAAAAEEAAAAQVERAIERLRIRAPVSGTVASLGEIRIGQMIRTGQHFASIVPDGPLRVVAYFERDALGRIATGQPAAIKVDGLPWREHGVVDASVSAVAGELHEDRLRVEFIPATGARLPIRHGMTGTVEVAVETSTPARLLLRAAGATAHDSQ